MAQHLHEFSRGWPRPGGDLPAKSPGRSGPQHHLTGPPRISPPRRAFSCPSSCRLVGARTRPSKNLPLERVAHTRTSLLGRQNGAQLAAAWRPVGPNPSTDRPCPMTARILQIPLAPDLHHPFGERGTRRPQSPTAHSGAGARPPDPAHSLLSFCGARTRPGVQACGVGSVSDLLIWNTCPTSSRDPRSRGSYGSIRVCLHSTSLFLVQKSCLDTTCYVRAYLWASTDEQDAGRARDQLEPLPRSAA
jgi:hypothetical protein